MLTRFLIGLLFVVSTAISLFAKDAGHPYSTGERLEFKIYFEFILGGDAVMSVAGVEEINGTRSLRLLSEARSTSTVDMMYKVRDRIESWSDVETGATTRYQKRLREGKWKDDKLINYDQQAGFAFVEKGDGKRDSMVIITPVIDVLTAFYRVRECTLVIGKPLFFEVHDVNKQYTLQIDVLRRETVEVPAGTFECIVIEPLLKSSGIFRKEGVLQIWLTDDRFHMPVLMQSKLYFGRVWAKLDNYRRGEETP